MRGIGSVTAVTLKCMGNQEFLVTTKGHVNQQGRVKKMMLDVIIVEFGSCVSYFNELLLHAFIPPV